MGFKVLKRAFYWSLPLGAVAVPLLGLFLTFPSAFSSIAGLFKEKDFLQALKNSLYIGFLTSLFSTAIGGGLAFAIAKFSLTYRRALSLALTLPLFFLPYQFALGWSYLLPDAVSGLLFSRIGAVFVLTGCFYPVVFWLTAAALCSVSREEEEAALLMTSPLGVLRSISLPRAKGGAITGALLVFLLSFSELGVPTYLGVNTVSYQVLVRFSAFYDIKAGVAASFPLMGVGLIILVLEYSFLKKGIRVFSSQEGGLQFSPGRLEIPLLFFIIGVVSFYLLLPFASLFREALDLKTSYLALSQATRSLLKTFLYSSAAALVAALWAFFSARKASPLYSLLLLLGFLTPPASLAVGIMETWGKFSFLYSTGLALVIALVARYYFLALKVMETSYQHLDPSGEEAALLAGASTLVVFSKVTLPSLRRWVAVAFLLVFVFSVNELGLSSMLYPPGGEPLVVRLYTLSVNNSPAVLSSLSLMNSLISVFAVLFLLRKG